MPSRHRDAGSIIERDFEHVVDALFEWRSGHHRARTVRSERKNGDRNAGSVKVVDPSAGSGNRVIDQRIARDATLAPDQPWVAMVHVRHEIRLRAGQWSETTRFCWCF